MADMKELRAQAKELGINSFGMKKVDLEAAVRDRQSGDRLESFANPAPSRDPVPDADRAPREETRDEPAPRRRRVPLGTPRQKLSYPARPGYVRRWFNDTRTRIQDAQDAGYEFVEEMDDGRPVRVSRRVGVNEDGSPMMAFLMEIRQEFYDEDQAAKQRPLDEFEAEINNREIGQNVSPPQGADARDAGHYYQPSDNSRIGRG